MSRSVLIFTFYFLFFTWLLFLLLMSCLWDETELTFKCLASINFIFGNSTSIENFKGKNMILGWFYESIVFHFISISNAVLQSIRSGWLVETFSVFFNQFFHFIIFILLFSFLKHKSCTILLISKFYRSYSLNILIFNIYYEVFLSVLPKRTPEI